MTDRERFKAICRGERPDYVPIFGLAGAPGISNGCLPQVRARLIEGGMPGWVGARNHLFALRDRYPEFILMGWLEKEVVNEGNEHLIEPEIRSKVPRLLAQGHYFPNLEHGMQPFATFENLCKFATLLHEVSGNPEGEFPRMYP